MVPDARSAAEVLAYAPNGEPSAAGEVGASWGVGSGRGSVRYFGGEEGTQP